MVLPGKSGCLIALTPIADFSIVHARLCTMKRVAEEHVRMVQTSSSNILARNDVTKESIRCVHI